MGYRINKLDHPAIIRKYREINRLNSELYRVVNQDGWRKYMREYYKNKLNTDPGFKLAHYARTFLTTTKKSLADGRLVGSRGWSYISEVAKHINDLMILNDTTLETMTADGYTFEHICPACMLGQLLFSNGVTNQKIANKIINDPVNVDLQLRKDNYAKHDRIRENGLPVCKLLEKKYPKELNGLTQLFLKEIQ